MRMVHKAGDFACPCGLKCKAYSKANIWSSIERKYYEQSEYYWWIL